MKKKLLILIASVMLVLVGCGSKPTLAEWVEGELITSYEEQLNSQGGGIHADFSVEGDDILVFSCIYDEQLDLSAASQDYINSLFSSQMEGLKGQMSEMFTACEGEISGKLSCIRIQYVNADGTIIYSYDYKK